MIGAVVKYSQRNAYFIYEEKIAALKRHREFCRELACQEVLFGEQCFNIRLLQIGQAPPDAPTLVFVAGVHGLESIGVDVLLNFMHNMTHQIQWSGALHRLLSEVRLLMIPMLNPSGIACCFRSNLHGVDLMRNAPIDAKMRATPLVGGHRLGPFLPWYRGKRGVIEQESQLLFDWCQQYLCSGPMCLLVDIHSGFGLRDQVWYPYAGDKKAFPLLKDIQVLQGLFDEGYKHHHHYIFSQQSEHYLTHGDLWDWIFDAQYARTRKPFYPLTLELGSWLWLKKNPRQLLNRIGLFYPMVEHRRSRVLRQHLLFFEFLLHATHAWEHWARG